MGLVRKLVGSVKKKIGLREFGERVSWVGEEGEENT